MTRSTSLSQLPSEFDDFLHAPIGEDGIGDDGNGMLLSVLSALARLNLDPWQEAAKLAALPGAIAAQRLAALIAELPNGPMAHLDPGTIAARLIARLPRQADPHIPSREMLPSGGAATNPRAVMRVIVINAIFIVFVLGTQWIMGSHPTSRQVDKPLHAPASSTVSPQVPPLNSGHSRDGGLG
jgi:hypothetical protein